MKIRIRIILFVVLSGLLASSLLAVWLIYEMAEQPFRILNTSLRREATRVVRALGGAGAPSPGSADMWLEVTDAEGRVLYAFHGSDFDGVEIDRRDGNSHWSIASVIAAAVFQWPFSGERGYWMKTFDVQHENKIFRVRAACSSEKLDEEIREIFWVVVSSLVFMSLALTAAGQIIAEKILRPIREIRALAQNISDKNLEDRVPIGKEQDELSELSETLNQMLDRLQFSFIKQKELLFETSHELKTPLTTIRLAVEELFADKENALGDAWEKLSRLEGQVLRMERLVKGLLSLSSLEALHDIDMKPTSLRALLLPLADEYRFLAENRNIRMDVDVPEELAIRADGEKMRRAFSNVLDNAVKYNLESGGLIQVRARALQKDVTVVVSNTGEPVPREERQKIFEQFYRVEKSRSLMYGGSGLGLTIVRKMVELHGGKVRFESVSDGSQNLNHLIMTFPI